eukprot:CAMPEP_0194348274 /NCGR_PEP_ID=MMETSP0171-20130528/106445_1 /TAXON_ID=218684 /ORGANISM="Corethron pennatum, Strain L29A3" /LENGTH=1321 /DNA_ID=CAMNT_0039115603 /DNA_START=354 /DNA_END=4320 /DNA_ORIENTATION=-
MSDYDNVGDGDDGENESIESFRIFDDDRWDELPDNVREAAVVLGYTKKKWNNDICLESEDIDYVDLTQEQKDACKTLGYTESYWNSNDSDDEEDSEKNLCELLEQEEPEEKSLDSEGNLCELLKQEEPEEKVLPLINTASAKEEDDDGKLPLHLAAEWKASDAVVAALLEANPHAAKETDKAYRYPLHLAAEYKASKEVVNALLKAYPEAAQLRTDHRNSLPDDLAQKELSEIYNNTLGSRPLLIAAKCSAPEEVVEMLWEAFPDAAKKKDNEGFTPLAWLLTQGTPSGKLVTEMLKLDMPIDLDSGFPIKHSHSWSKCLASSKKGAVEAVEGILNPNKVGYSKHINKLVQVLAENKRPAFMVAASEQEKELNKYLFFCGRFEVDPGAPEHRSATSVVLRAKDRNGKTDYQAIFNAADKDGNGELSKDELQSVAKEIGLSVELFLRDRDTIDEAEFVSICARQLEDGYPKIVIKLMTNEEQWTREKNVRSENNLRSEYVVGELKLEDLSDKQIRDDVKDRKGLDAIQQHLPNDVELGSLAIFMEAADRNLQQIYLQERPDLNGVRVLLTQAFEAVAHLHERNIMHGDLKMLNLVRFQRDNRLRLIDLDAAARIPSLTDDGEPSYAGAKFSSATLPPEMLYELRTDERELFKKYWEGADKELCTKVAPKLHRRSGKMFVVKSFRTEKDKPLIEGLPYELVEASAKIDVWSLGTLAFELLTGETLVPANRDDDCVSGKAMCVLHDWNPKSEVALGLLEKITDDAARGLVSAMLQDIPSKRPKVQYLLKKHPFFHPKSNDPAIKVLFDKMSDDQKEDRDKLIEKLNKIHTDVKIIKELSFDNKFELRRARDVLLMGIFEANEVTMPTTFIVLDAKLPEPPTDKEMQQLLEITAAEDGSGVKVSGVHASFAFTEEGASFGLEGELKEKYEKYEEQFNTGMKWMQRLKKIGSKMTGGAVDEAFGAIKDGLDDLVIGNMMYLYLVDELTGEPVRADEWPIEIREPADVVSQLLPVMQAGMHAMSIYNGAAGVARMFGFPVPKVPKEWSKGAQESVNILKKKSSVEEYGSVQKVVDSDSKKSESLRGKSLRVFKDFMKEHDPGLKASKEGDFAGLRRIGNPSEGTALWTTLTDINAINTAIEKRKLQREEEDNSTSESSAAPSPVPSDNENEPIKIEGFLKNASTATSPIANLQPGQNVATAGKVHIIIDKGSGFNPITKRFHKFDVPDVYCVIKYGTSKWQTHFVKDDEAPVWSVERVCKYVPNQEIIIDVYDKNRKGSDDYYGQACSTICKILNAEGFLELEVNKEISSNRWSPGIFISVKCQKLG